MSESPAVTPATDTPDETAVIALVGAIDQALKPETLREELDRHWGDAADYVTVDLNELLRSAILDCVVRNTLPLTAALRDEVGRLRTERGEATAAELDRQAAHFRSCATLPVVDRWDLGWRAAIELVTKGLTARAAALRGEA